MLETDVRAVALSSDPARFREARRLAYDAAHRAGLDAEAAHALAVAVSEVCANVHRHAYGGRLDERLDIRFVSEDGRVAVVVIHSGAGFDPERYVPPDLSRPAESGYGLFLVRRLVDSVRFEVGDGETRIVLVKERCAALAGTAPAGEDRR